MLKNLTTITCNGLVSAGEEVTANFIASSFTSGGGFSRSIQQPSWQSAAVQGYLNKSVGSIPPPNYFNSTGVLLLIPPPPPMVLLNTVVGDQGELALILVSSALASRFSLQVDRYSGASFVLDFT